MFGIASQRYENRVDLLEYKHTAFLTTVAAGAPFVGSKLKDLEDSKCPMKPDILNPFTVFRSMFMPQGQYPEFYLIVKRTVEEWKTKLSKADLSKADLNGADLSNAILSEAILIEANLSKTKLAEADLGKRGCTELSTCKDNRNSN